MQSVLITGGAGFIGQNLVHAWRAARPADRLIVVDAMTYAANIRSLEPLIAERQIAFVKGDIGDAALMRRLFDEHKFTRVVHLAAESHVDRSIVDPERLPANQRARHLRAAEGRAGAWRAHGHDGAAPAFFMCRPTRSTARSAPRRSRLHRILAYRPNSPYAASKAASDHLVRSFVATYGMPALITNCSNNYGPYQHPEKLIPLMIIHALEGKPLPIYGDGSNVRDWLHVSDHCDALMAVIERGRIGETYNVGGGNERNNRDVVGVICDTIDRAFAGNAALAARFPSCPAASGRSTRTLISFVTDRPGHDHRYAIDATQARGRARHSTAASPSTADLRQTVRWYLDHEDWWRDVTSGAYKAWIDKNYGFRIAV